MSDTPRDHPTPGPLCQTQHAQITLALADLSRDIRGVGERTIALQADVTHMRGSVDRLDRLVRGNGTTGLATQLQILEHTQDDLEERMQRHEDGDAVVHREVAQRRWQLVSAVIICVLSALLSIWAASCRAQQGVAAPRPQVSAPAAASPTAAPQK